MLRPTRRRRDGCAGRVAETPDALLLENDAPHAMAHLLLRDGDARFATERLPGRS